MRHAWLALHKKHKYASAHFCVGNAVCETPNLKRSIVQRIAFTAALNASSNRAHSSSDPVKPIRKLGDAPCSKSRVQIPRVAKACCSAVALSVSNHTKSGVAWGSKP